MWLCLHALLQGKGKVTFVVGHLETDIRSAQGWKPVDLSKLNVVVLPPQKLISGGLELINENSDAIHVFVGFTGTKVGYNFLPLILYALVRKVKVSIINEPYSLSRFGYSSDDQPLLDYLRVLIRPVQYRAIALLINLLSRSGKPCIFPISLIAKEQFSGAGFALESLFPFGWFVPNLNTSRARPQKTTSLRMVYVGTMQKRKGVDLVVGAVRSLRSAGYELTLDLFGPAGQQAFDRLGPCISYKGRLTYEAVQSTISNYDVLVLPSRHDGWGVVVNEAILQGVPVIASDRVGAKCLLQNGKCGLVFHHDDAVDLANKIISLVENEESQNELRRNARTVSEEITPQKGAQYYLDVLEYHFYKKGNRPTAIWCEDEKGQPDLAPENI